MGPRAAAIVTQGGRGGSEHSFPPSGVCTDNWQARGQPGCARPPGVVGGGWRPCSPRGGCLKSAAPITEAASPCLRYDTSSNPALSSVSPANPTHRCEVQPKFGAALRRPSQLCFK